MTEHSDDDLRPVWDIYRFAEETLSQRMNYGMVAQSMLLLGFITLFAYQYQVPEYSVVAEWVIGLLGFIMSVFQYAKITDLTKRIATMQNDYLNQDQVYAAYLAAGKDQRYFQQHHVVIGLGTGWLALLTRRLPRCRFRGQTELASESNDVGKALRAIISC